MSQLLSKNKSEFDDLYEGLSNLAILRSYGIDIPEKDLIVKKDK